ncbi:uteroglobin [Ailuropoda melanoleuca]|uniref:Uteroglobin n=2 Tax=Ursidae TaxID=9632 RepID=G1LJP1_AILME|nr:uteroglobin [Ursus maritimus]XP_034502105.1 uteroglobin [Ailuropoda melanoleuca]XP_057173163.1 uteroglobin [Ursus arctos]
MKLAVILALATLALCCSPASAAICPNFLNIIKTLFLDTLSSYEAAIEFFVPDPDMKDAMVQLKSLVNTLPANTTENILKFTELVLKSPVCA